MPTISGKTAICISGEARTAIEAHAFFREFYPHDADVFYHTWDADRIELDRINKLYKPVSCLVQERIRFDSPLLPMLYSMMIANDLKRQHEIRIRKKYDRVIRTRFDLIFDPKTQFPDLPQQPRTIYSLLQSFGFNNVDFGNRSINDVFFWGDSLSMDIACDSYRWYQLRCSDKALKIITGDISDPEDVFLSPGTMIYRRCVNHNIFVEQVTGLEDVIFRPQVRHMHPIHDFVRINRYFRTGEIT